jgi:hypothetical protein
MIPGVGTMLKSVNAAALLAKNGRMETPGQTPYPPAFRPVLQHFPVAVYMGI